MESDILKQLDWIECIPTFKKFMEERKGKQPSPLWDEVDALASQMLDISVKLKDQPALAEVLWLLGVTIASQDADLLHPIASTTHNLLHLLWDMMRGDSFSTQHPIPSLEKIRGAQASTPPVPSSAPPAPKKETYH